MPDTKHEVEIAALEKRIKNLINVVEAPRKRTRGLKREDDLKSLLKIIRKPGWTSIAEFRLVSTYVDHLTEQVKAVEGLKTELIKNAKLIGSR
jgi:hypothetical protein